MNLIETAKYHFLVLLFLMMTHAASGQHRAMSLAGHSVLSEGEWYRIAVGQTGIQRITYDDLVAMGIDPAQTDPATIRIYGNGNGMLDESNATARPDDLSENAIEVIGEEDGRFDPGDYILFYGEGPVTWTFNDFYMKFEHELNLYTDQTCYFLTSGRGTGKRIRPAPVVAGNPTHVVTTFNDYRFHEKDEINLIKSGKLWWGEVFSTQLSYDISFSFPHLDLSQPLYLRTNLAARSPEMSYFRINYNGDTVLVQEIASVVLGSSIYARSVTPNLVEINPQGTTIDLTISYDKPNNNSAGWLNYIEINSRSHLIFEAGQLQFRDVMSAGTGNTAQFEIDGQVPQLTVWDVTDPYDILIPETAISQGKMIFKTVADSIKEFVAFDGTQFHKPVFIEKVPNQDLHALEPANLIIVAHPPFMEQAFRLADFRLQNDGITSIVITPQQIYNEFSTGAQDVSAIRDFMKMLHDKAQPGQEPRYLLLFGDASFDYKNRLPEDNNLVPTFESRESLKYASSFVSDDFFGCLDEGEGSNGSGTQDIGIGRFPVQTVGQAKDMVDKVIHYSSNAPNVHGSWRNDMCFIGDDGDNNIHLGQAEDLTEIVDSLAPCYNISKIYLDAYTQLPTPSGDRYPEVNNAIDQAVEEGMLIVNYTGHGGEIGWGDERVLDMPMIQGWNNLDRMPAFVTATCEFSRFDDPALVSAGELVILNPKGGGIGLFTTTRLAYSQSNFALNKRFYDAAFEIDSITGEYPRMGDLIRKAKTPSNQNIKNFVLLGDPSLMLAYPDLRVKTLSVTSAPSEEQADTLKALMKVTVTGAIEDLWGNPVSNFNGLIYPKVFDKPVIYKTRGNDPNSKTTEFSIQDKLIYKGVVTVQDGNFIFTFVTPRDISYQVGWGKISYYAVDTSQFIDAQGHEMILIGGADNQAPADIEGPEINVYLNNYSFISGDITTPQPVMIVFLKDESGINTVGNGIGHDITAILNDNLTMPIVLNDYFIPATDSHQEGEIRYVIGPFAKGEYSLTLKAWDICNNSSEKTVTFLVDTTARLSLSHVYNYPNPFNEGTYFTFSHNKPGEEFSVMIRIYSLMGKELTTLEYEFSTEYLKSDALYWDGRDESGNLLAAGLYLYEVRVTAGNGYFGIQSQKMMILR